MDDDNKNMVFVMVRCEKVWRQKGRGIKRHRSSQNGLGKTELNQKYYTKKLVLTFIVSNSD